MKLRKASEEPKIQLQPVSFRLSKGAHDKLQAMSRALEKKMSRVLEDIIPQAYEAVSRDYPKELREAEVKLKKSSPKSK